MAATHTAFIPFLFLFIFSAAAHDPPKPVQKATEAVVEGVVYCQSCDNHGTWGLAKAKPIEGATVGIICKDHKNRVSFYKACKTDKNGYFYGELKGYKMMNYFLDHPLHACKVKLVASPLKECNILTNVNYGLNGSPLRYNDKKIVGTNYEAVVYAAGPLAFRPTSCAPKAKDVIPEK